MSVCGPFSFLPQRRAAGPNWPFAFSIGHAIGYGAGFIVNRVKMVHKSKAVAATEVLQVFLLAGIAKDMQGQTILTISLRFASRGLNLFQERFDRLRNQFLYLIVLYVTRLNRRFYI